MSKFMLQIFLIFSLFDNLLAGTFDSFGCVDLASNCQSLNNQGFCNNQVYLKVMVENCKLSCNFCNFNNVPQQKQPGSVFPPQFQQPNLNAFPNQNPNQFQNPNPFFNQNPNQFQNPFPAGQFQSPASNCYDKSNR